MPRRTNDVVTHTETIYLPEGHKWREAYVDTGCGVDYLWECQRCDASFYVNIDQGHKMTEYLEGKRECLPLFQVTVTFDVRASTHDEAKTLVDDAIGEAYDAFARIDSIDIRDVAERD